ncbi:MAG TPA: peptidylprolyl isomerase [Candidatus Udaeobacter sp.]|jgi:parvulin-like peptidyl-prolyl isomerase|nr:peptidylprolyl isomerase [Candidatus Udaeobacter sp.]
MSNFIPPFVAVLLAVGALVQVPIQNASSAENEPTVVDGIAAVVNGEVITYSQVRALSSPQERLLRQQYTGPDLEKKLTQLRQAAVKDLIDRRLVIQAFKKESFQIPDHLVDQRIQEIIKEAFGGDRNTFVKTLEAQNYTLGEFKEKEMEKIIVGAMRSKNVKSTSIVPPNKIDEYYKKHRDEFTSKEQIKLRMIMISGHKDTASAPAQKELAEEVLGKLASGAEFEQMAQVYSEDSTKDNGGDWGWIERKTLAEPLEKFAFNMPVGRISNIIDYAGNYYILKVEDKHGGTTKSLTEVRADIEKKLEQEAAQQIQERWIASLRQKAYIKTF